MVRIEDLEYYDHPLKKFLSKYNLLPHYEEEDLFLMGISVLVLYLISKNFRDTVNIFMSDYDPRTLLVVLMMLSGMFYSIYHAFISRKKTSQEKNVMIFFAIMINAVIGIVSAVITWHSNKGIFLIFPIINIFNAFFLMYLLRINIIDGSNISDKNTTYWEILFGTIVLFVTIYLCFYYGLHWSITFSISVAYATNLNNILVYIPNLIKKSGPKK